MPKRVQRQRTKGWRMPEGAVYVGRPSRWGNPFDVRRYGAERAVALYADLVRGIWQPATAGEHSLDVTYQYRRDWLDRFGPGHPTEMARGELAGHDLACWCALDAPCHADVLLELANW